ncbi:hypothetical protein ASE36_01080 [Rhizobium sp. Root274]|uniref:hypothetical protein n=1 Tax=unclassified Rhizobium TaxID=2613769 RepID=UPI0007127365|nr:MULTISPECIES: hypothetical protein [unclassified Rhizobium]KQW30923.1 hypothetical protein ASC71_01085 [Rhizobium sp. Root1240]KRD32467.1 hypothetical protein ASE36_01080 [Rhizobium sp. Root274]
MKRFFAAALLVATPALAQTPSPAPRASETATRPQTVEDACIFVAKSVLMVKDLKVGVVQAFPDLKPPGARLTYSTRMDAGEGDITDEIECQFDTGTNPTQVTRFCMDSTCYASDSEDPEDRRRFEEVQALMQRLK